MRRPTVDWLNIPSQEIFILLDQYVQQIYRIIRSFSDTTHRSPAMTQASVRSNFKVPCCNGPLIIAGQIDLHSV